jgi:signal peptidase II
VSRSTLVWVVLVAVLLIDQSLKFWVKLNMTLGDEIIVANWARLHFTENPGMAFGMTLGGSYGKLILSLFRIVAIVGMMYYLRSLVRHKAHYGLIASIALIMAGAMGNIFDSALYGLIFSDSYHHPAVLFPPQGGYAGFLHGRVVDMFYFPLFSGYMPDWVPLWGGEYMEFFRPIFNVADSAISIGVFIILIFQHRFFQNSSTEMPVNTLVNTDQTPTTL